MSILDWGPWEYNEEKGLYFEYGMGIGRTLSEVSDLLSGNSEPEISSKIPEEKNRSAFMTDEQVKRLKPGDVVDWQDPYPGEPIKLADAPICSGPVRIAKVEFSEDDGVVIIHGDDGRVMACWPEEISPAHGELEADGRELQWLPAAPPPEPAQ